MKVICDWCGSEFDRKNSKIGLRNYCSRACLGKANAVRFRNGRIKTCDNCGRGFEYKGHHTGRNSNFFCCKECADVFRTKQIEVECDCCGKRFMKKRSDIARTDHNFCCEECYRNYIELTKDHRKGPEYGKKPLYRILMEKKLGRELTSDEEVHHIDGNHLNNDPANLEVLSKSEHAKKHAKLKNRDEMGAFVRGGDVV